MYKKFSYLKHFHYDSGDQKEREREKNCMCCTLICICYWIVLIVDENLSMLDHLENTLISFEGCVGGWDVLLRLRDIIKGLAVKRVQLRFDFII